MTWEEKIGLHNFLAVIENFLIFELLKEEQQKIWHEANLREIFKYEIKIHVYIMDIGTQILYKIGKLVSLRLCAMFIIED